MPLDRSTDSSSERAGAVSGDRDQPTPVFFFSAMSEPKSREIKLFLSPSEEGQRMRFSESGIELEVKLSALAQSEQKRSSVIQRMVANSRAF